MATEAGERITTQCASCHAVLRVPAGAIGKRAKCPKCGEAFQVSAGERRTAVAAPPDAGDSASPRTAAAGAAPLRFHCPECDGSVKVPARAAGKRVKCPHCTATITAPSDGHAHPPSAHGAQESESPPENSFLDDLGGGEAVGAPTIMHSGNVQPCPHCSAPVSAENAFCLACGKSVKGGGLAAGAALGGALKGGLGAIANAAKGGNFLMGCIGASIGAIIGGAIWYAIANSTGYQLGYIAWAVGALTGIGMMFGYKSNSYAAGAIAAGIAVAGIIGAKYALFYGVVGPLMRVDPFDKSQPPRTQLIQYLAADDATVPQDEDPDSVEYKQKYSLAEIKARSRVEKMSDEKVKSELDAARSDVRARLKGEIGKAFWKVMFGGMDIVFFLLAIATAFRVGSGLSSAGDT